MDLILFITFFLGAVAICLAASAAAKPATRACVQHVSHWLRRDLPHRIKELGVPVTVVSAKRSERSIPG